LRGRRALVTGASRNLGAAIAAALAGQGAVVAVNHRHSAAEAHAVVAALPRFAGEHVAVQADVGCSAAVERMIATVAAELGGIDILVNNAGPYGSSPLAEATEEEWDRVIDGNVKAAWLCTRAAATHLGAARRGRVINVSAVSAGVRNRGSYGLAKAAVEILTEQLAVELATAATVNAVAPGQIHESLDELAGSDEAWAAEVTRRTPGGRLVTRGEVADVVALLCGDAFDAMTGATLPLDGGLRINRF
jgi:3-oxoacyl-[acyl-carrier protein] reductase